MGSNQKRLISGISVFAFLLGISVFAFLADAQQGIDVVLADLRANAKLHAPDDILADFVNGKPETAVIVLLQPTAAAKALAAQSGLSAQVPAEFTGPGAATYYNLQDESIRSQLQATVTETVNRVIGQLGATGMTVTQRFSYQFGFAAKVTPAALERIVNSPDVVAVEKDHILDAHLAQGIPLMNATTVRGSYTGSGLSIAICDTGIDTSHPRLGGGGFPNSKVIGGYDTGDNDADPRPNSVSGNAHGTAAAGIAAGNLGTVGDYIGGVAPGAKLYAVKISTGTTGSASTSAMIAGWEWCITHKNDDPGNPIMIISTSFGSGRYFSTCDSASSSMTTAAANAVAAGITIFASSGNDGYCDSIGWPACISYVNSVGAVYDDNFGTYLPCISSSSCAPTKTATTDCSTGWYATDNTQPDMVTSYSNSASFLTLFAPANRAYTADIVGSGGYSLGDYHTSFGGTSAACPYAAGSAAVLQQAAKAKTGAYLTPAQVKTYLVNNGDNVTDGKVAVTKPRINLGRAVDALTSIGGGGFYIMNPNAPYSYILDANNRITSWVGNADDGYFDLSLAGFDFQFYGTPVTSVRISTNGYITFGTDGTDLSNDPIPTATDPNAIIAAFWDDLNATGLASPRGVWWKFYGTAPNRYLVIEWYQVPRYGATGTAYSFEIILYESTDRIKLQYLDVDSGTPYDFGGSATVGIENFDGTKGVEYSFDGSTPLFNGLAIEFIFFSYQAIVGLVTDYYLYILDRPPEPGGAEAWTAEIERIMSLGIDIKEGFIAVGKSFFNSAEYLLMAKTNAAYVTDLYETFLQRPPTQAEINYWVGYLTQGMSRNIALYYFVYSAEFKLYMEGIFGVGAVRPENNLVNDFYRGILNRLPDTAGFNAWLGLMRTAQCTGAQQVRDLSHQIALGFIQSAEYVARGRTNSQYVGDLYDAILRRGALPSEVNYWINYLSTSTRAQVLQFFTDSPEFQIRVTEVINAGCLS